MKSTNASTPRSGACVRIACEGSDIAFITAALKVAPTRTCIAGERRSATSVAAGRHEQSIWMLESTLPETSSLEEQIASVTKFLEQSRDGLSSIQDRVLGVDMFCLFSTNDGQGSIELSASLLRRLGNLGVDLVIDVYSDSSENEATSGDKD